MEPRVYLHDPLGWSSDKIHWVALLQSERYDIEENPEAILADHKYNDPTVNNMIKALGYIPGVNFIIGIAEIAFGSISKLFEDGTMHQTKARDAMRENHSICVIYRGIATFFLGPLLFPLDLIKCIYDSRIASEYMKNNPLNSIDNVEKND